jgi:hypothetical protein
MTKSIAWLSLGVSSLAVAVPDAAGQQTRLAPLPTPSYKITLGGRDACVTPFTRNRARADGGIVDVQASAPDTITFALSGTTAADSYLGCTSTVKQHFSLVQDFEVTCSDAAVHSVSLTLDSRLAGYVRSMRNAGACVRLATVSVTPESWNGAPLTLAHPPLCAIGTQGRLCNQHLPPVLGPPMPVGRFTLVAEFVLEATASGICNAHAAADFSPDTTLPAEWVRMRDPFQGVSKRGFGLTVLLTAAASPVAPASARETGTLPTGRRAHEDHQTDCDALSRAGHRVNPRSS